MSKSGIAVVFLAGPLSGIYADSCKHRLGRRRPFMMLGGQFNTLLLIKITIHMYLMTDPSWLLRSCHGTHRTITIWLAAFAFYLMDFSLNVVMVTSRCLIVDILSSDRQAIANAYYSRIAGIGAVSLYSISEANLPKLLNSSSTQLKLITMMCTAIFIITLSITCMMVREKPLQITKTSVPKLLEIYHRLYQAWVRLGEDSNVKRICWITFWSSIGWFPVLFYSSTWIVEIWTMTTKQQDREQATRIGSQALLSQSIVSLIASIILPIWFKGSRQLAKLWMSALCLLSIMLVTSWVWAKEVRLASGMIGILGISWAVTLWAPSTLLAQEILDDPIDPHTVIPLNQYRPSSTHVHPSSNPIHHVDDDEYEGLLDDLQGFDHPATDENLAGTIYGIQNIFAVIPQLLINLFASGIFKIVKKDNDGPGGITMVFVLGGFSAVVSAWGCWKLIGKIHPKQLGRV
ncbi:uncharacterized protein MELLADRAFT_92456 [Melampsora larici-populina 98AG31]|uniref:Uncharacterized protein n=1 Tax=Melampsora larici-populina (strain 98AG31 / pathotype 3-4-7) TaxID=747676 RepID=F4R9R1_MELLP|nr:uncharacterized protein MELLADRAFT_92456 [Melampsora larici-populina 98AG31]EGG11024.1 hypothetical protein MELLADRAFT_92456 [Melampsora larici-populina 98AG31]